MCAFNLVYIKGLAFIQLLSYCGAMQSLAIDGIDMVLWINNKVWVGVGQIDPEGSSLSWAVSQIMRDQSRLLPKTNW